MMASREPPLRPPSTTPTRWRLPRRMIGDEVEAGRAGVAGLDAVDALDAAEQVIMAVDGMAVEVEGFGREVAVIFREAVLDGAGENRLIARRGVLFVVGKAGSVA